MAEARADLVPEVAIAHLTLLDVSPPDLVDIAAATGYGAIGVRVLTAGPGEDPWPMTPGSPMLRETARRLADTGLRVLDVEVLVLRPDTSPDDYEPALESGAALGARFLNVMGDDPEPERVCETFARLTADARPYGLRPLLEPIPFKAVRTPAQAVHVAERSGGGGVEIDALHVTRSGTDPDELREIDPGLLALLQVCDAPLAAPSALPRPDRLARGQATDGDERLLEARAMRRLPGAGELPLAALLAAMPPGVPVSLEAPVWPPVPPLELARRGRSAIADLLAAGTRA